MKRLCILVWSCALCGRSVASPSAQTPVRISPIAEARTWLGPPDQPVSLRGVLTRLGEDSFVQDSSSGVMVHFESQPRLRIGEELELSGLLRQMTYGTLLEHTTAHVLWGGAPLPPVSVNVGQAARGDFDNEFIQVEAGLESVEKREDTTLLHASADGQQFVAILEHTGRELPLPGLQRRSMVRLRGICSMSTRLTHNEFPFVLLLRSGDDVEQLAGPPWWSSELLIRDCLVASCLVLVAALIRFRVRRNRERAIEAEREFIALELHDTLAQSFAGLSFQLQAVRSRLPPDPPGLDEQVNTALSMVRYSHLEARRSIAALRDRSVRADAVAEQIRASAKRMIGTAPLRLKMEIAGEAHPLALRQATALVRVAQEAVANALQHALARCITVRLEYSQSTIALQILDDGCGFDIESASQQSGFGLRGMQARMQKLHGTLSVHSTPGKGTAVSATVRSKGPFLRPRRKEPHPDARDPQ